MNKLEAKESVTIGLDIPDAVFVFQNFRKDLDEVMDEVTVKHKKQQERKGVVTENITMCLKILSGL